jgi:hypothetical protein
MDITAREVGDAGSIARGATRALSAMVDGIARVAEQSDEVASLAQTQATLAAGAVSAFDALDASATKAAGSARGAAESSIAQRSSIDELSRSAAQLSQAAARMRSVALRHTQEFAAVRPGTPSDGLEVARLTPRSTPALNAQSSAHRAARSIAA